MKTLFLIFGFIVISFSCFSQDLIVRTNGNTIDCKIISVDSVNVSFTYRHRDMEVETKLAMNLIEKIIYEGETNQSIIIPDSIYLKKVSGKFQYIHNEKPLNNNQLYGLLSLNKLATVELQKANSSRAAAMIFGFAGGFMIGWPLGTLIAGGEPKWYLAGIGGGLILLSIPFSLEAKSNIRDAVDIYNEGIKNTSMVKMQLLLGFTQNGIGVRLIF